jgi:hypothetical protein
MREENMFVVLAEFPKVVGELHIHLAVVDDLLVQAFPPPFHG